MSPIADDLPALRDVIARHDLGARKRLGQHFLLDANLTRKIARTAGDLSDQNIIEIGPGPGGLTRALLELPNTHVIAVERDARCVGALRELGQVYADRLHVIEGDALELNPVDMCPAPRCIVANLPYNISTALLVNWLPLGTALDSMTLMFQKEVAQRLVAAPGGRDYGRLSVAVQWRCHTELLFDIPPSAFVPPPKVTSTVVRLVPRQRPLCDAEPRILEKVTAAAFGQRRKMLRASLRSMTPRSVQLCETAGVDPTARAEDLSIDQFCAVARAYQELASSESGDP